MIKFWDAQADYLNHKQEIDEAIQDVLLSGNLVLGAGDYVPKFEREFAAYVGKKHAIMCGAGTQALYLAYRALGIGPGDEVITPSLTFAATFDQVVAVGAKPILVDIGEDGLIDIKEVEKAITKRTRAIVPVHLEGKVCQAFLSGMYIVEDTAQACGAKGVGFGVIQCYSMFPAKILGSIGNAGMCTTDNDELAEKIKMLRCNYNLGKNPDLENAEYGANMEPDNIQAAVLSVRIKYHDENLARRQQIAWWYSEQFKDLPIILPLEQEGRVWQDYVMRVDDPVKLQNCLKGYGIGTIGVGLNPHHAYKKLNLPFLPKTDEYLKHQIRIPCNSNLTDNEVQLIGNTIKQYYEK